MSRKTSSKNPSAAIHPAVIAAAAVLLVVLMGGLYYVNFTPHSYTAPPRPGAKERIDWINAKARETQGDYSKLSPADREMLEEKTERHGAMALGMAWKGLSKGADTQ